MGQDVVLGILIKMTRIAEKKGKHGKDGPVYHLGVIPQVSGEDGLVFGYHKSPTRYELDTL